MLKKYGMNTEYRLTHYWVERQLGKPSLCSNCGDTSDRRYAWANISGEYKRDVNDWERLCYPCHQRKDKFGFHKQEECSNGHPLEEPNLYIYPSGKRECVVCRKIRRKVVI